VTPIGSAPVDERGKILWGDQLMILFSRDVLAEAAGRGDRQRGEMLADARMTTSRSTVARHHVEGGAFADQEQD